MVIDKIIEQINFRTGMHVSDSSQRIRSRPAALVQYEVEVVRRAGSTGKSC